jgi:hypothetical protein
MQPYRQFTGSLRAVTQLTHLQESLLPFKQFEASIRPLAEFKRIEESLLPLKQFESFTSFRTFNNLESSVFPLKVFQDVWKLPGVATFNDIQSALGIPTENIRWLTNLTTSEVALDSDALAEFEQTVDSEAEPGAPPLLYDRLLWLPSVAQRRVYLAAIWALKELVSYMDLEANVPPPGHVLQLVSLLWAVAFALSELIEYESPDN